MDSRLESFLRRKLRSVGREFEAARRAYREGRDEEPPGDRDADAPGDGSGRPSADGDDDRPEGDGPHPSLPRDEDGVVRLACRRHAERRAVRVDDGGRPSCYDGDHPDCRGCVEDVREGTVETW